MAAPEGEREVRKRRERRDSGCAHERKERRPHSEERAPPPPPPLHDHNRLESERRAERLSRARRPQFGGKRRRQPRTRNDIYRSKENECLLPTDAIYTDYTEEFRTKEDENYGEFRTKEDDYSEFRSKEDECLLRVEDRNVSPERDEQDAIECLQEPDYDRFSLYSASPSGLDLGALHRQLDREEPARSHAAERPRPAPAPPAPAPRARDHHERQGDRISRKITVLKKTIAKYEADFQRQHGYAITPSERITDVALTTMQESLRKLQAEKRLIKADPVEYAQRVQAAKLQKERDDKLDLALKSEKSMSDVVRDIEEWLEGCRQAGSRCLEQEATWTASQLSAEKSCVQRALLRLEAARGRPPVHSAERGAARHLYERYREVKRALASAKPDALIGGNGELATIHEHEAMLFNCSVDSASDSQEKRSDDSQETADTPLQSPPTRADTEEVPSTASSCKSATSEEAPSNEGLHCLSLEELTRALSEAKLLKCVLRRSIKEYEASFEQQNCRKLQRDDKKGKEEEYLRYKALKARIKLLNALINKHRSASN
ncbi:hypothetical protein JYU34_016964 [Plutella xylostella]|uniref:FAM13A-like domain-containing protein n=1 Tax=Plutella xylostella TaxID=51655 RepID=A0ABQ7Q3X3_PLUXY|nr:hypothetical protein JYU34_016964 [Plutella xylostella]